MIGVRPEMKKPIGYRTENPFRKNDKSKTNFSAIISKAVAIRTIDAFNNAMGLEFSEIITQLGN